MARFVLVVACLAVAACSGAKKPQESANAGGTVLAGSISDAMIDLDKSRAEAPLAGPGAGVPAGENAAARDLLAAARPDAADEPGSAASEGPALPADKASKAVVPANPAAPREKPAEQAAEPRKPPAKPAASAPVKPKPAFRKPSDDGGV